MSREAWGDKDRGGGDGKRGTAPGGKAREGKSEKGLTRNHAIADFGVIFKVVRDFKNVAGMFWWDVSVRYFWQHWCATLLVRNTGAVCAFEELVLLEGVGMVE